MVWTPPHLFPIIRYVDGQTVYLSNIRAITEALHEIRDAKIDVIIALLEEPVCPPELYTDLPSYVRHHHFPLVTAERRLRGHFFGISRAIHLAVDRGRNVLVYDRDGQSACVAALVAFFLYALARDPPYVVWNYFDPIPKLEPTWVWSFVRFIHERYPVAFPTYAHIAELTELERELITPTPEPQPVSTDATNLIQNLIQALESLTRMAADPDE